MHQHLGSAAGWLKPEDGGRIGAAAAFRIGTLRGDPMVFVEEPISLAFLLVAAGLLLVLAAPAIRARREEALKE